MSASASPPDGRKGGGAAKRSSPSKASQNKLTKIKKEEPVEQQVVQSIEAPPVKQAEPESSPPDEVKYLANRRMAVAVNSDGTKRFVEPGDEVPEAYGWKPLVRERYVQEGHIHRVVVTSRGRGRPAKSNAA